MPAMKRHGRTGVADPGELDIHDAARLVRYAIRRGIIQPWVH